MTAASPNKGLNIGLWIAQGLLAALFLMAGISKFTSTVEQQRAQMEWARHVSEGLIHFTGIMEILGALGLVLPAVLRIQPWLTPLSAALLGVVIILATALNIAIGQNSAVVLLVIVGIAFFVAWGRFKKAPILPK